MFDELGLHQGLGSDEARTWVSLVSTRDGTRASGQQRDSKAHSQGVAVGVTHALGETATLGLGLAQTRGQVNSDGKATLDVTQLGMAVRGEPLDSGLYLGGTLGVAQARIASKRNHDGESAKGHTSATRYHASLKVGRPLELGDWTAEPSLDLGLGWSRLRGTGEKNATLRIQDTSLHTAQGGLGLALGREVEVAGWLLKPELSARYEQRFGSAESIRLAYQGQTWRQRGARHARGEGSLGLSLEARYEGLRARMAVSEDKSLNLSLGVSW